MQVLHTAQLSYDMVMTKKAGHGVPLAATAYAERYQGVVAVGGDGMIPKVYRGKRLNHPMMKMFDGNLCGKTPEKTRVIPSRFAVIVPERG